MAPQTGQGFGYLLCVEHDAAKISCVYLVSWMLPGTIGGAGCACADEMIHAIISMLETPVLRQNQLKKNITKLLLRAWALFCVLGTAAC